MLLDKERQIVFYHCKSTKPKYIALVLEKSVYTTGFTIVIMTQANFQYSALHYINLSKSLQSTSLTFSTLETLGVSGTQQNTLPQTRTNP